MVTLLDDNEDYRPLVNLARRQIGQIEREGVANDEAAGIIQEKLRQADRALADGNVVTARRIWYSIVGLYGDNANVEPLVARAQSRLAENASPRGGESSP
jgi:hypothetical protein